MYDINERLEKLLYYRIVCAGGIDLRIVLC